ncbi:MAG: D-alanyl-D-alanine carboxypeptidase [Acidimicrobiia bacterium]|nr:D-alanyl-D-alanine carboxypeptidase [Acidimicrobiia bacterium]
MSVGEHEHGMRVDLVAAPARYPPTPLIRLLLVAVVPAAGLLVLHRWSDAVADDHDLEQETDIVFESALTPEELGRAPSPELATSMFDYRRTPAALASVANINRLSEDMQPLYAFVNDTSCVALTVDGVAIDGVNEDVQVIPASTQKLLVATVALETLGPEHRYTTTVTASGVEDGVVTGDLYLIGGGDPLLTSDEYPIDDDSQPAFHTTSLDSLADAVVAAGITRINGVVIGDGTRYDDEWFVDSWAADVPYIEAGPYDALMVNDSRVLFRSSRQDDPNEAAAREFTRLLADRGVALNFAYAAGAADPAATWVASIDSAPLSAVVQEMLVTSDDNTAELMLKEIGLVDANDGSRIAGLNAIDRTLRGWGIAADDIRIVDGSGLSADNRLTCAVLVDVLARGRPLGLPPLLPTAGESGTLTGEFVGTPMEGRMHAKTGTLGNPPFDTAPDAVKALAGYIDTETGAIIEFAVVLNTPDITVDRKFEALWFAFADRVSTYPAGPAAAEVGPR